MIDITYWKNLVTVAPDEDAPLFVEKSGILVPNRGYRWRVDFKDHDRFFLCFQKKVGLFKWEDIRVITCNRGDILESSFALRDELMA